MKRKYIVTVLLAAAAAVGFGAFSLTHVRIDGEYFPKNAEVYDLRAHDLTAEDCAALQQRFPETEILWGVLFQGKCYAEDTTALTLTSLTEEEAAELDALPKLREVDATGCTDYEALLFLQARRPECKVHYRVAIGSSLWDNDVQAIILSGADTLALEAALPLLPQVTEVTLEDSALEDAQLIALAEAYPDIFFLATITLGGREIATDSIELDLTGCQVTAEEVAAALPALKRLEKLILTDCGLDNDTLDVLNQSHPEVDIVWTVEIGPLRVRTDEKYFFPAGQNYYPTDEEMNSLRYCHDMIAVDIGHTRARQCEWLYGMPHLKFLILADTAITDITPVGSLKELIYLELFGMDLTDYSPLLGCTALQDLNLGETFADPTPIGQMTWLHTLQWYRAPYEDITRAGALALEELLPDTYLQLYPSHSIGRPWRYIPNYYLFRDIIGGNFKNQWDIENFWGEDSAAILACDGGDAFAGGVLAELVKERILAGEPIPGIQNDEDAWELYITLTEAKKWLQ